LAVLSETVANVEFNAFYRAERRSLVRFVMFLGADADTAEDVAQTTFTQAFSMWHTIRFPHAWLRKVAQHEYFRHCRDAVQETSLDAAPGRADRPAGISAAVALEQQAATREILTGSRTCLRSSGTSWPGTGTGSAMPRSLASSATLKRRSARTGAEP
jgi:DNA-directed RNA polymerase specialized sigma24 family protein